LIDTFVVAKVVNVPLTVKSPERVKSSAVTVPVNVGEAANTKSPVPVFSVTADLKFADDGVAKKVATPVPKLLIPVPPFATGSVPVTFSC
jgi:hypothetical protein